MSVSLRDPLTGRIKVQPEGWSWGCFFASGILGIPLFTRGLLVWGAVMVVFNATYLIVQFIPTDDASALEGGMGIAAVCLSLFFAMRANAMAIDRLRGRGWEFADRRLDLVH